MDYPFTTGYLIFNFWKYIICCKIVL